MREEEEERHYLLIRAAKTNEEKDMEYQRHLIVLNARTPEEKAAAKLQDYYEAIAHPILRRAGSIEAAMCIIQETDWLAAFTSVIQGQQRREQARQNIEKVCMECKQTFRQKDMYPVYDHDLNLPPRLSFLVYQHCRDCSEAIVAQWRKVCTLCSAGYYAQSAAIAHSLCDNCATPELVYESRRIRNNTQRTQQGTRSDLTLAEWVQTLQDFSRQCAYCQTRPYTEMDHFIPIKLGGETSARNVVPACTSCNSHKQNIHPDTIRVIPLSDIERVRAYLATRA